MTEPRIAVYGAGSLGIIVGAFLSKANLDVTLIDVWQENVDKLNNEGAKVVGTTTLTTPVKAATPDDVTGQFDVIFLLTKQVFNDSVVKRIKELLAPDGTLVSLQNGLPEKYILTQLSAKNVVSGAVEFGASAQGPAVSELTTEYDAFKDFAFKIGEIDGSDSERIHQLKSIMDNVGDTHISDNLMGTKWTKLLVNASFSGLSAAANATFGDVSNSDIGILGALNIMNEGLLAGQADGITFDKMGPLDPTLFLKNGEFTDQQIDTLRKVIASSAGLKASMLQDLEKGRKTEISDINGVVATVGKEHGIPTPFNDFVIQSVKHSEESGTLPNFDTTMTELEKVLNAN